MYWLRLVWFGTRFPLGALAGLAGASAVASALGTLSRTNTVDAEALMVAVVAFLIARGFWPGPEDRAAVRADYEQNPGKPPFTLITGLGGAITSVVLALSLLVLLAAMSGQSAREASSERALALRSLAIHQEATIVLAEAVCGMLPDPPPSCINDLVQIALRDSERRIREAAAGG